MTHSKLIGILGGTFDPIHQGHLSIAEQLIKLLPLNQIQFIPCQQSPLRQQPLAATQHRWAMLEHALKPYPAFSANPIELQRNTPLLYANHVAQPT